MKTGSCFLWLVAVATVVNPAESVGAEPRQDEESAAKSGLGASNLLQGLLESRERVWSGVVAGKQVKTTAKETWTTRIFCAFDDQKGAFRFERTASVAEQQEVTLQLARTRMLGTLVVSDGKRMFSRSGEGMAHIVDAATAQGKSRLEEENHAFDPRVLGLVSLPELTSQYRPFRYWADLLLTKTAEAGDHGDALSFRLTSGTARRIERSYRLASADSFAVVEFRKRHSKDGGTTWSDPDDICTTLYRDIDGHRVPVKVRIESRLTGMTSEIELQWSSLNKAPEAKLFDIMNVTNRDSAGAVTVIDHRAGSPVVDRVVFPGDFRGEVTATEGDGGRSRMTRAIITLNVAVFVVGALYMTYRSVVGPARRDIG